MITEPAAVKASSPMRDRRHDRRVAAGAHAVADVRRVLVVAVVVGGDVAGGDVAVPADDGVADVAEVRHLAALADAAVLDLDEGAGLGALGEHGVGADVGERPDAAAGADDALVEVRADDARAVADEGVAQEAAGADLAGRADGGAAEQVRVGADERVAAHLDAPVHVGGLRVLDGDAGEHEPLEQAPAHGRVDDGELDAGVDAHAHLLVVALEAGDGVLGVEQQVDDVGEVELALVVVAAEARQRRPQRVAAEHVEADVDLVDLALLGGRVAVLDDARDAAVVVAHDAAVVRGVVEVDGGERGGGVGVEVPLVEGGDEVAVDQRHVAVQHHDVALEVVQRLEAGADGVAGAAPLLLHGALAAHRQDLVDRLLVGAGDDDDALGRDAERGVDDVREHGPAAHLVQDLGDVGLHARAEAGRQDDDGERRALGVCCAHLAHLEDGAGGGTRRLSRGVTLAGAGGFEPPDAGTKTRCLTTWLRPSA